MKKSDEIQGLTFAVIFGILGLFVARRFASGSGDQYSIVAISVVLWTGAIVSFVFRSSVHLSLRSLRRLDPRVRPRDIARPLRGPSIAISRSTWKHLSLILVVIGAALVVAPAVMRASRASAELIGYLAFSTGMVVGLVRMRTRRSAGY